MTVTTAGVDPGRGRQAQPGWRRSEVVVLVLAGLLISGFTVFRRIDPFDEGLMLQAAERIAHGQLPYRDFVWPYGPAQPLLVAWARDLLGPSLLDWRLLRVLADCSLSLWVFVSLRSRVGPRWALAGWAVAIFSISQPTGANPFAFALLFSLCAVSLAARPLARVGDDASTVAAGVFCGLAAAWRFEAGLFASVAVFVALLCGGREQRFRPILLAALGFAVMFLLAYLPFVLGAGVGVVLENLVGTSLREGGYWRLPFVVVSDIPIRATSAGALLKDLKDLLGDETPLLALIGFLSAMTLTALAWRRDRQRRPLSAGLAVLGCGYLLYLRSRPDEFHVQPLIIVVAALGPLALGGWWAERSTGQWLAWASAACVTSCLALIGLAGFSNRVSAAVRPPALAPLALSLADGVRVTRAESRSLPQVVAFVQHVVPPGEPVFVAPARSDLVSITAPILYFLVQRPNVRSADVAVEAAPAVQRSTVVVLRRTMPRAVIRWLDPIGSAVEPNRRGTPSRSRELDQFLDANYQLALEAWPYEVLVPRR
jgi:hypothetical protein